MGKAALGGFARGLTGGLSDDAAHRVDPEVVKQLAAVKEANPITSGVSEFVGMLAPLLATRGASAETQVAARGAGLAGAAEGALAAGRVAEGTGLLSGALRTAGVIPRATAALGGAVERTLAPRIGSIGAKAAAMGTEMAIYGMGNEVSRAALANEDLTAEKLVAGGLEGFKSGAMFGAGAGAAGAAFSKLFSKAGTVAEAGEAAKSSLIADKYIKIASGGDKAQEELLRKVYTSGGDFVAEGNKIRQQAVETLQKDLEAVRSHVKEVAGLKGEAETIKKFIKRGNEEQVIDHVGESFSRLRNMSKELEANAAEFGGKTVAKDIRAAVDGADKRIAEAIGTKDFNATAFKEMDYVKRKIDEATFSGTVKKSINRGYLEDVLKGENNLIRSSLEDSSVWGEMGNKQKSINKAYSELSEARKFFDPSFTKKFGDVKMVDPKKISSYVGKLGTAENANVNSFINDYATKLENYYNTVNKELGVKVDTKPISRLRETLSKTEKEVSQVNALKNMVAQEEAVKVGSVASGTLGGVIGGAPGAAIGGIVGTGINAVTAPLSTVARIAKLENIYKGTTDAVGSAVKRFASSTSKPAVRASAEFFLKGSKDVDKEFDSNKKRVEQVARNLETSPNAYMALGPGVASKVMDTQARMANYLMSTMPKNPETGLVKTKSKKDGTPKIEKAKWNNTVGAVIDPKNALGKLSKGHVTKEEMSAIKAVYPALHASIVDNVAQKVADKSMPYSKRLQLSTVMGTGVDRSTSKSSAMQVQAMYASTAQRRQPTPMSRPVKIASSFSTRTNSMTR